MTQPLAKALVTAIQESELSRRAGRITDYDGLAFHAHGPDAWLGEICQIGTPNEATAVLAEVIGFGDNQVTLMPYGRVEGIRQGAEVFATGQFASITVGPSLLGRFIDAFGRPLDDREPISGYKVPLHAQAPSPAKRQRINQILETGICAIDTLLPLGIGQRIGIFSGSGVGKSTLLGMMARNSSADVNVVALIGERGREVREFIEDQLDDALTRSIVVVATAEQPALVRLRAAQAAVAVAEYFRAQGKHVALYLDSLTRLAMAQREIGLAVGEPPTVRGYPPSVFSMLPQLLERMGTNEGKGSITGILTVLVEGDDLAEPVSDHARAVLDGHIVLTRDFAQRGQFPPIDVLKSASRLARSLVTKRDSSIVSDAIGILALYESSKDMIDFGGYTQGSNTELDRAVQLHPKLLAFLRQAPDDAVQRREESLDQMALLLGERP